MITITFIFAAIYVVLGISFYILANFASLTALIPPLVIALIFAFFAAIALKPKFRMHAMHATAIISFILFLVFVSNYATAFEYLGGGENAAEILRPLAAVEKTFISLIALAYFIITFISFAKARLTKPKQA